MVPTSVQPRVSTNLSNNANNVGVINSDIVSGVSSPGVIPNYNNVSVMENANSQMNNNVNVVPNYSNSMNVNNNMQSVADNGQLLNNSNATIPNQSGNINQGMMPNNNVQNGLNNVVTSNGAQPFDISSMFGNNQ